MPGASSTAFGAKDPPIATVELSAQAAEEIAEARAWWLANRDKAPEAFDEALDNVITQLEDQPEWVGAAQKGKRRRRVLLARIRYYLYFRVVDDGARVEVLAFWHASRGWEP